MVGQGLGGVGFHVTPDMCVTCAHVIDPGRPGQAPPAKVEVAPLFNATSLQEASVVGWAPALDAALLRVAYPIGPSEVPPLRYAERRSIADQNGRWRAWGLPGSAMQGLELLHQPSDIVRRARSSVRATSGSISDRVGHHRYQVVSDSDLPFEGGYSGGAVREDGSDAVIGMLTSRASRPAAPTVGFMVTLDGLVSAFPVLARSVGWMPHLDTELRAAWRWEDDDLRRPSLGSHFTGRTNALSALRAFVDGAI
ncbi:trypsin-like peptidase domain-containing protein [Kineococcus sp. NUM-3379]